MDRIEERTERKRQVLMDELTWQEFAERVGQDVIILPVGSTEQHAPHLPLGVDAMIARGLAGMLAERVGGIVAPTIAYGYKSQPSTGGGPLFPGTTCVNAMTLISLVRDILVRLLDQGARRILILNAHYENELLLCESADLAVEARPEAARAGARIAVTSWWDLVPQEVLERVFDKVEFPGWALEHAAVTETSLVMFFAPELVRLEQMEGEGLGRSRGYTLFPVAREFTHPSGRLYTARGSSAEKGRLLAEAVTSALETLVREVLGAARVF